MSPDYSYSEKLNKRCQLFFIRSKLNTLSNMLSEITAVLERKKTGNSVSRSIKGKIGI